MYGGKNSEGVLAVCWAYARQDKGEQGQTAALRMRAHLEPESDVSRSRQGWVFQGEKYRKSRRKCPLRPEQEFEIAIVIG